MNTAKQLVVFSNANMREKIKKAGFYPYGNIQEKNILYIELPNTFDNTLNPFNPIRLNREFYRAIEPEAIIICLNTAIKLAQQNSFEIEIKQWSNPIARKHGIAKTISLKTAYLPYFNNPDEPAAELLSKLDDLYAWGGCVEITAVDADDEIVFYHQEDNDTYLTCDLFDFLSEV